MDRTTAARFAIGGPVRRADLPGLVDRVCRILRDAGPGVVTCDVSGLGAVDAVTVEALARLQLAAGRLGCRIRLRGGSEDLRRLIALLGLADVLVDEP